jgi:hypothetical protein
MALRPWLLKYPLRVSLAAVLALTLSLGSWGSVWSSGVSALYWSSYLTEQNQDAKAMGLYLKSIAKPGDRLLAWMMEPQIFVYSGLRMAAGLKTPLVNHLQVMPEEQVYFTATFSKQPPQFIVVSRDEQVAALPGWLGEELQKNWESVKRAGRLELYIPLIRPN